MSQVQRSALDISVALPTLDLGLPPRKRQGPDFNRAKLAERSFGAKLGRLAVHIGHLIEAGFDPDNWESAVMVQALLRRYSETIRPWARAVVERMLREVDARNKKVWGEVSAEMGVHVQQMIRTAPIGGRMQQLLGEQVQLITSLPIEAAQRVHELTLQGTLHGVRPPEIAREILRTGEVTRSRALLIARTEVARTALVMTQARAEHAGSTGYIWRTVGDADVRPDHRLLEGTFHQWNDPPIADRRTGARAHPGSIYNCRCTAQVILPAY